MKSSKNKIRCALVATSFLLVSCDQLGVSKEQNIVNACIEMKSTTIGISGPSKRIDIAKEYGIPLDHADAFNTIVHTNQQYLNALGAGFPNTEACIRATENCQETLSLPQLGKWRREVALCNQRADLGLDR